MAQQTLNNAELGSVFRGKLNDNYSDLYAGVGTVNTASVTGNVTLDFSAAQHHVLTLTGNLTLDNPTTEEIGQSGMLVLIQDATGGRTLTTGTQFKKPGGNDPVLSTAANAVDVIPYVVTAADTILIGTPTLDFS